jgi:hypothetical protein
MPQIKSESVDKLKDWLRLPVEDSDGERAVRKSEIEALSPRFGGLVFEDERWYEYDADRINQILQRHGQEWLDGTQVTELESLTDADDLGYLLAWFEPVLTGWESGEAGVAGAQADTGQELGIANPNYAVDPVPGTQFYKYDPTRGYLYADTENAVDWWTLEERVDAARPAEVPVQDNWRQRGYPNTQATIPGTRYYTLRNDVYLYNDREYGDDDHGWQPYEYWQGLQVPATRQEPVEPAQEPVEPQPAPATIDAAVEEATATAFANLDAESLAGLALSEEDIERIADTVSAQIASGMAS